MISRRRQTGLALTLFATAAWLSPPAGAQSPDTPCGQAPAGFNVIISNAAAIVGTSGRDFICAGDGDNTIEGRTGGDIIFGGAGDDRILGNAGNDELHGGPGSDQLKGGLGNDTLHGNAGADRLNGGPSADELWGGAGNDRLDGDRSPDRIHGGLGNDRLLGGAGADHLRGGDGNDVLIGQGGDDVIAGDAGNDHADGRSGEDRCVARRMTGCEGPILDAFFGLLDRTIVTAGSDDNEYWNLFRDGWTFAYDSGHWTPGGSASIDVWADSNMSRRLWATRTTSVNSDGGFSFDLGKEIPLGAMLAVTDEATGHTSKLIVNLTLDAALSTGVDTTTNAFVAGSGPADENILVTTRTVPSSDFIWFGRSVHTVSVPDDGNWFLGLRHVGAVPIEVAASSVTSGRDEQVVTAYAASQPIIDVGPRGLDGFGWMPGADVFVRVGEGPAEGPIRVDTAGRFSGEFAAGPIGRGTTVEVLEAETGRVKSINFLLELLFYRHDLRSDYWHVEARALKNAPGVAWVRYDDGTQSRTQFFDGDHDGFIRTSFEDGELVDFGVISFQDPDGDWMTASYRLN